MKVLGKLILTAILMCCAAGPAAAQFAVDSLGGTRSRGIVLERPDTLNARIDKALRRGPDTEFRATQLIAPVALVTSGVLVHCFAHESLDNYMRERVLAWRGSTPKEVIDDYVQYVPFVFAVGLGALGQETEHRFVERAIVFGISTVSLVAITRTMKEVINSPRPDGSDAKSFPSGHTATAFTGAEFVRMEYGWGWGICAYALATGVGVLRINNDKHWFSDVLTGAGIGIFSAHVGEWLLEPTKRLFKMDVALLPQVDPFTGSAGLNLALKF
jgi:hypothetical protein